MNLIPKRLPNLRRIRIKSIYWFLIFLLMIVPDDAFNLFPVYTNQSPSYIAYKWLNYSYNAILLVAMLLGLIVSIHHRDKWLWVVICLATMRELFFWMIGVNSCFTAHSYEIYLTLLTGVAIAKIVQFSADDIDELNLFFWRIIVFNVLTVYIALAMNAGFSNRYNAVNMDVGSTGTICAFTIIYCLFNEKIKGRMLIAVLALIALFLSGSRVNLLLTIAVLSIGLLIQIGKKGVVNRKGAIAFAGLAIIGAVVLIYLDFFAQGLSISSNVSISRMLASLSLEGMGRDDSVIGRTASILAGFDIVKQNIFGISGYFTNLQYETVQRGFPTFPHSSLLVYYILLGPVVILLVIFIVNTLKNIYKRDYAQFLVLLHMTLFITFSGGPIVNFKLIFIYTMILILSANTQDACTISEECSDKF